MRIFLKNHPYRFEVEQTALMLLPAASPRVEEGEVWPDSLAGGEYGVSALSVTEKSAVSSFFLRYQGKETKKTCRCRFVSGESDDKRQARIRHTVRRAVFLAITGLTGETPAWGVLAGVRPAKLARTLLDEMPPQAAEKALASQFFVGREKASLAVSLAKIAKIAETAANPSDTAFYIGVPFCPSRCAYCSFIGSSGANPGAERLSAYLTDLRREIEASGRALQRGGASVRALYVGGGTPTIFSEAQLTLLLETVHSALPLLAGCEITVEAGRPDTVTAAKIEVLRAYGVGRVSVNPQSFSDEVLQAAGRKHSAALAREAYALVRRLAPGMQINMDFIAGLPKDTQEGFAKTIEEAVALGPDNITVHTLALKRGADWAGKAENDAREVLAQMLSAGQDLLLGAGYTPYYLYRQKYMGGSFENIGYERHESPCLYNIFMMEEVLPVVACGAGATTKLVAPGGRFRRIYNPKFAEEYSRRIDEILAGKDELTRFFANWGAGNPGDSPLYNKADGVIIDAHGS